MYTLCCTGKILKRTGFIPEASTPAPTTALGDWYVNLIYINRIQLLLFVSDKTRMAVVTPAKNTKNLRNHLTNGLSTVLRAMSIPPEWIRFEINEMKNDNHISKTRSRSILGTMNDYKYHVECQILIFGRTKPYEISMELNQIPIGSLNYRYPSDLTIEAFRAAYERPLFD